MTALLD